MRHARAPIRALPRLIEPDIEQRIEAEKHEDRDPCKRRRGCEQGQGQHYGRRHQRGQIIEIHRPRQEHRPDQSDSEQRIAGIKHRIAWRSKPYRRPQAEQGGDEDREHGNRQFAAPAPRALAQEEGAEIGPPKCVTGSQSREDRISQHGGRNPDRGEKEGGFWQAVKLNALAMEAQKSEPSKRQASGEGRILQLKGQTAEQHGPCSSPKRKVLAIARHEIERAQKKRQEEHLALPGMAPIKRQHQRVGDPRQQRPPAIGERPGELVYRQAARKGERHRQHLIRDR